MFKNEVMVRRLLWFALSVVLCGGGFAALFLRSTNHYVACAVALVLFMFAFFAFDYGWERFVRGAIKSPVGR